MKKIRWGIVGPGSIANRFAKALRNVDCAELVAVASREESRAQAFAEKYGIPHVFRGYEAMADSDIVDAVYVATPHSFHKPCAELFLKAGKHVLCEKPVCVNADEARALKECAEANGVFLMEAMWTRFLPAVLEAREIVKRGDIGEIIAIEADFCYPSTPNSASRLYRSELAGGALLDVGVYCLHFASLFLGNAPESITAVAHTNGVVDLHTTAVLKYKSGAIANLSTAINVTKPETAYIYGTKGHIYLPCFYGAQELFVTVGKNTEHIVKEYIGNGFEEEIIEVCRCIGEGRLQSDIMPMEESIVMMQQMDTIRQQIGIRYTCE